MQQMIRRSVLSGLMVTLGVILLTAGSVSAQTGRIEGRVVEAETGDPLAGVNLTIPQLRRGTTSDPGGGYVFTNVPTSAYRIEASFLGYGKEIAENVIVRDGETTTIIFRLEAQTLQLDQVIVSATRSHESLAHVPASVTTIGLEELNTLQAVTGDLGSILSQVTPGLSPSTGTLSNYGQTLRGRDLSVLIDGVPQSTPLRSVSRSLRTIDPSAIRRIEVIRGASATYGYGATGGVINIITKRPAVQDLQFKTEIGTQFFPGHLGKSLGGRFMQQVSGRSGIVGYTVTGSYQQRGLFFDAEGDPVPPDPQGQGGLALSDEYNLLAKIGVQLTDDQRIELTANYYNFKQNLTYKKVPGVVGEQKATAVPSDSVKGKDPGTENLVLSLGYTHENVGGSRLSARVYVQDYMSRFGFLSYFPGGGQSYLTSTKVGARVDMETPLGVVPGSTVLWGLDALTDRTAQPLVDGRSYVPPIHQASIAPFAQLELPLGRRLLLRGGVRYEYMNLQVDDFRTLIGQNQVEGGSLTYDAMLFNAGGVVFLTERVELFGSFSQGFSISDIGRALRSTSAASVEQFNPEAQKVTSYEIGLRGGSPKIRASVAGFVNTSNLGSTYSDLPELRIIRSPERIYGIESTLDLRPTADLGLGGTFTYLEGKRDADMDGSYETYLPGPRIPPLKITGYVSYTPMPGWQNRLQFLYSGSRNRFPGSTSFGQGEIDSYVTIDLYSAVDAGPGTLKVGIKNLLNNFYFPTISQWYNYGTGYTAAPGRRVSVSYSFEW